MIALLALVIGLVIGWWATRAAAWVAAKARILELEERHDREWDRQQKLQSYREESIRRGFEIEALNSSARVVSEPGNVVKMRGRRPA